MPSIFFFSFLLWGFFSRGVGKFLPFSAPHFVGYLVEQKNVAFVSLEPIISQ
jgi:hypothetical protein